MVRVVVAALAALVCSFALRAEAFAEGALVVRSADGGEASTLPLTRTDVAAEVSGQVTSVTVTQRFHNAFSRRIEAVYVFPLPDDAAVDSMEMRVGRRVLRAVIDRRNVARARYEQARDTGRRAALLEQERPNVFTFNAANLDPGADVDVSVHFFGLARYDHATYEMALPMVVGPRYIPGTPLPHLPSGTGVQADTDRVPDASRVSPAYVPPGTRSGHALGLRVHLDAGAEIESVEAPAHDVTVAHPTPSVVDVALRDKDEVPNRDFVLRWKLGAPELRASVLAHRPDANGDGYLALTLEPRHDAPPAETAAREVFFLLDTSGSMQGPPLDAVKRAVRSALVGMGPSDAFQIIDFADGASALSERPLAATPENVARGLAYLEDLQAGGGTNQLLGIHAALAAPGDPMRLRYVVFMTDGYIGNEREVAALTRREVGDARVFAFGVGASVNRYLLEEVAAAGRGFAEFLRPDEDPEAVVGRFYDRIARPYLTDVRVDWGALPVRDALPSPLPDLSSLQPLLVLARYERGASGDVIVTGRVGGRPFSRTLRVSLPETNAANGALASLWARQSIAALAREEHMNPGAPELAERITALALRHHLLSRYTSFVAVDEASPSARPDGPLMRVDQPAEAPQHVSLPHAGGAVVAGASGGDAFGYGGLGVVGRGAGGGGRGEGAIGFGNVGATTYGAGSGYGAGAGRGLRGRSVTPAFARPAAPEVMGALSPEVIRRVVLRGLGPLNRCYEAGLARDPTLAGRVVLRFVIGPDGRATPAIAPQSAPGDAALAACMAAVVRTWVFPAMPGSVTVSYPFNLTPPS